MIFRMGQCSWALHSDTVDRWADVDRRVVWDTIKPHLTDIWKHSPAHRFYKVLAGGTTSFSMIKSINTALSIAEHKIPPSSGRRIPTDVIRKIEIVSNSANRKTMHKHLETSIDYYQEREEGLVPVYRKIDRDRFVAATTRGRPGCVTAAEQRVIEQWAEELRPMHWPELPPREEMDRCAKVIGLSRQSWRGSWFGGAEVDLMRASFWKTRELWHYLEAQGYSPQPVLNLVYKTARNRPIAKTHLLTANKLTGRLAVIAVIISNGFVEADQQNYEGSLWNLNRLLPLDARRWLSVQYDWKPAQYATIPHSRIRDLLAQDYTRIHDWISSPGLYPIVYNCELLDLWPVLEQSAWFFSSFIDAINGRGWGDSQAARYIRGEI